MARKLKTTENTLGKFAEDWRGYRKGDTAHLPAERAAELSAAKIFTIDGDKPPAPASKPKASRPKAPKAKAAKSQKLN